MQEITVVGVTKIFKKQIVFSFLPNFLKGKQIYEILRKWSFFIIAENDKVYVINIGGLTLVHCPNTVYSYTGAEKLLGSTNKLRASLKVI